MKKTYIAPSFFACDLAPRQIIAASMNFDDNGGSGSGGYNPGDDAQDDAMVKGSGSTWDNEW